MCLVGRTIFKEGDAAFGLFVIVRGTVGILHSTATEDIPIARLGPGAVFGEMGLILSDGHRTATARAVEDTMLHGIPIDPGELFIGIADANTTIRVLQNVMGLLGERLRSASTVRTRSGSTPVLVSELQGRSAEKALHVLQKTWTTSGLLARLKHRESVQAGDYLFHQGDDSTDFYLIHSGVLEVIDESKGKALRLLTRMYGPNVVGEIGFFLGRDRLASCRAAENVEFTCFLESEFKKLRENDVGMAFEFMLAAVQLAVQLIVERQIQLHRER